MALDLNWQPHELNYYADLVRDQKFALVPAFTLESGIRLNSVPIAYKTWGTLNKSKDNVIVLCHALTGSADAEDWWRPLMGRGKTFDDRRFFIFCANVLGSPYGSASPLTFNSETGQRYGPLFPLTSIRDDVRIQKMLLDAMEIQSVAAVIGGSMGGMLVLEWPLCSPAGYVKQIIPIATSAYHDAWGISWGEAQRQCIYSDASYQDGMYNPIPSGQPKKGMGTARMVAMLTYRSQVSFEARFGRQEYHSQTVKALPTPPASDDDENGGEKPWLPRFSAQSYLQYQADKFLNRFDANCYIHLTNKMNTHDVTRGRRSGNVGTGGSPSISDLKMALKSAPQRALVISVSTDILFQSDLQIQLADTLSSATFLKIDSLDGHDGFLLEMSPLSRAISNHLRTFFPQFYQDNICEVEQEQNEKPSIDSIFGEAASDQ